MATKFPPPTSSSSSSSHLHPHPFPLPPPSSSILLLLFLLLISPLRHWVKVIILLTVVMGISWVANILFFDVRLLFIAYIMTIFIAGQGIIIFILLVPLSKQVGPASHA